MGPLKKYLQDLVNRKQLLQHVPPSIKLLKQKECWSKGGQTCPWGFTRGLMVKNLSASAGASGDVSLIPGSGRSPGEENGKPRG